MTSAWIDEDSTVIQRSLGQGETITGYVEWTYRDCRCSSSSAISWCRRQRGMNTYYPELREEEKSKGCKIATKYTFPSSPWGCCLFCGKGGKVGGTRRGGTISPNSTGEMSWGSVSHEVRHTERTIIAHVWEHERATRHGSICHGCKRRLDNLYNGFMDCNDLIRKIQKEQIKDDKATEETTSATTAQRNQDDTRSSHLADPDLRRHAGEADHAGRSEITRPRSEGDSRYGAH